MLENVGRKVFLIVLLVVLSLGFLLLKSEPFQLGLDLQGGTRLVYSVDFDQAYEDGRLDRSEPRELVLDQMIQIIRNRVDPKGTIEPIIRRGGANRIVIELPGTLGLPSVEAESALAERLGEAERTSFLVADAARFPERGIVTIGDEQIRYDGKEGARLLIAPNGRQAGGRLQAHEAGATVVLAKDDAFRAAIESLGELAFRIVMDQAQLSARGIDTDETAERQKMESWAEANPGAPLVAFNRLAPEDGGPDPSIEWYPLRPQTEADELRTEAQRATPVFRPTGPDDDFRGGDLSRVYPTVDSLGFPAVGFELRPARQSDFGKFTGDNQSRFMAIVLNEEVTSAPRIEQRLIGGGIIRGRFTNQEVRDLMTVLRSGSLKIKPQLEYDERVGATLGDDYVRRGFLSAVLAVIAVLAFMAVYYRRLGVFAAVSLATSFLLLMGGLSFLDATLTLPGIAGIILTIGMAVDANILIFDRIREELDKGRNIKQAAKNGFDLALSAIMDANITTFLTAVILYQVGTGPVRGFAVTLMVGIVTSVFAALVVTRVLVHMSLVRKAKSFAMGTWMVTANYRFLSKTRVAVVFSALACVASVAEFVITPKSEKLGIDFMGGAEAQLRTAEPQSVEVLRTALASIGGGIGASAEVKPVLSSAASGGYTAFRATFKETGIGGDSDVRALLTESLEGLLLEDPVEARVTDEGSTARVELTLFFQEGHPTSDIAARLEEVGLSAVQVEQTERANVYSATATTTFGREENEVVGAVEGAFTGATDPTGAAYKLAQAIPSYSQVGPQVVGELRDKALLSLAISLFAVVLYIRVRFAEYSYGFAAVIAVFHDVLVTLGALTLGNHFGLLNGEMNLPMIAAFLTIIGYSLNDTIVIFDRVRENLPRMKAPLSEVLDVSINQTLSRTILTSFTTFIAVAILYGFNFGTGNTLESFSFAMMVGIVTGTYSTIYIANPILLWLESRAGRAPSDEPTGRSKRKKGDKDDHAQLAKA